MDKSLIFLFGTLGGMVGYFAQFKKIVLAGYIIETTISLRAILIGVAVSALLGGVYTTWILEAISIKQAILAGVTGEGFFLAYVKNKGIQGVKNGEN